MSPAAKTTMNIKGENTNEILSFIEYRKLRDNCGIIPKVFTLSSRGFAYKRQRSTINNDHKSKGTKL